MQRFLGYNPIQRIRTRQNRQYRIRKPEKEKRKKGAEQTQTKAKLKRVARHWRGEQKRVPRREALRSSKTAGEARGRQRNVVHGSVKLLKGA